VLITGGIDATHMELASAEIYTPSTGKFSPIGGMTTQRAGGQTSTLLANGRVLLAGGCCVLSLPEGATPLPWPQANPVHGEATADLYDPATGLITHTGPMAQGRLDHTATLLPDGRVLVTGGSDGAGGSFDSAELYDPKIGRFSRTGSMIRARTGHTATLLQDGRVLIVGGAIDGSAELYDPTLGEFRATGSMTMAHDWGTATLLSDGRVLIVGGGGGYEPGASAELYTP
jgi:hypothetical protein